jgi:hypothetical protein
MTAEEVIEEPRLLAELNAEDAVPCDDTLVLARDAE